MSIRPHPSPLLQGAIFDLFGTLVRPLRPHLSAVGPNSSDVFEEANTAGLLRWAQARGLPVPAEAAEVVHEARQWMWTETAATGRQLLNRQAMARAAQRLGWPQDPAFLEEASWVFFQPEIAMIAPYPDAADVLAALRDMGLRLAVVSNASDHRLVEAVLARTGLAQYLDPVVSSAGYGRIKPDPGIFRAVLNTWRLAPQQCVMVGDTLDADVGGAQALGMRAILVTMDPNPHNVPLAETIAPDAVAASLREAADIIRRWMAPR
ncbi:MAG: HAD family hydrolase [Armatimonadota bacterium]|nr:HAD family hydrolase [Armatimonadota bacterium]MDR7426693.1 HAD family hydrolase [Armatimonadota bacterium]MDR7469244.1 HAD family hydrolase [Armatimonadota bacterium]MDR7475045.1 HAD family hydrolase [Armatimonadota bacterium]MDR7538957.1 HAD family hydrolase [Armatimonadota bacterium]